MYPEFQRVRWSGRYDEGKAITVLPSFHSTTNLCCSIMRSRSPGSYFISSSNLAHNVSSKFEPRGWIFSLEKSPIHRRPARMRARSTSSGKSHSAEIREANDLLQAFVRFRFPTMDKGQTYPSEESFAEMLLWVTSAQVNSCVSQGLSVSSSHPSWTRALTNSGNP